MPLKALTASDVSPDLSVSVLYVLTLTSVSIHSRTSPPFYLRVAELQHFKMGEIFGPPPWVPFVDVGYYPIRYLPTFLNLEWIAGKQR